MSLTTIFSFNHTSSLPLPGTKPGQDPNEVAQRGISVALSLLHSPTTMISLNPLQEKYDDITPGPAAAAHPEAAESLDKITAVARTFNVSMDPPDPWAVFLVTDRFTMLFNTMSKLLVYRCALKNMPDGMESISDPGNGVALHGRWTVDIDETRPGYLRLSEDVRVTCNLFLGPVVRGQLGAAHEKLHFEFGRRFVEIMSGRERLPGEQQQQQQQQSPPVSATETEAEERVNSA